MTDSNDIASPVIVVGIDGPERLRMAALLEKSSAKVQNAETASQALALMRSQTPQALLSSSLLPDTDGHELCATIRRFPEWQSLPVFLYGEQPAAADIAKALEHGADDFLDVSGDAGELVARVQRCVTRGRLSSLTLERERADVLERAGRTLDHYLTVPVNFIAMCAQMLAEQFPEQSDAHLLEQKIERQLARLRGLASRLAAVPRMPADAVAESPELFALPDESSAEVVLAAQREHYRLLLVDDEPDVRALVRSALERSGRFSVREAPNGKEGLELAQREKPDVAILDLLMPVMNGTELCTRMKQDPLLRGVPVIVLTMMTGVQDMMRLFELGASGYLVKPFSARELPKQVLRILALSGV